MSSIRADIKRYDSSPEGRHELLQQGPEKILNVVQRAFSGGLTGEELEWYFLFWYSIAESAVHRTFASQLYSGDVDFAWAKLANTTFELLSTLSVKDDIMWSWMLFKVNLINAVGRELDPSLASASELVSWFFDNLAFSMEEVKLLIVNMQAGVQVDAQSEREFLHIRERAKTLSYLDEGEAFEMPPQLKEWIDFFNFKKRDK